jgi:hypothetical protein
VDINSIEELNDNTEMFNEEIVGGSVKAPCCYWSACGSSACRGESLQLSLPASGRIFPLSFSAGVLKNPWHWFLPWYLLDSTSGLSVLENQNEAETCPWKKEIGRSRRA